MWKISCEDVYFGHLLLTVKTRGGWRSLPSIHPVKKIRRNPLRGLFISSVPSHDKKGLKFCALLDIIPSLNNIFSAIIPHLQRNYKKQLVFPGYLTTPTDYHFPALRGLILPTHLWKDDSNHVCEDMSTMSSSFDDMLNHVIEL